MKSNASCFSEIFNSDNSRTDRFQRKHREIFGTKKKKKIHSMLREV